MLRIQVRLDDTQHVVTQYVDLQDARIGFRFHLFSTDDRWRMWLLDLDGTTIAGPIKLVPGLDLFKGHKHDPRVPQGELFVWGPEEVEPPNGDTVDVSSWLLYRTVEELT